MKSNQYNPQYLSQSYSQRWRANFLVTNNTTTIVVWNLFSLYRGQLNAIGLAYPARLCV
jgi:hypothetical protein